MTKPNAKFRKDYTQPDFLIPQTELYFNLDASKTLVRSKLSMQRNGQHNLDLVLDCEVETVLAIKLDGVNCSDFTVHENKLTIPTNAQNFILEIESVINPIDNTALEGLYLSGGVYCTQCEAEGFRRITPYLDRPDVLSEFTVHIFADGTQCPFVLSNGNQIKKTTSQEDEKTVTYVCWHDPHPKPSYLFALVAGDFDLLKDKFITCSGREVTLELFVDKGKQHLSHHAMESLKRAMKWDEEKYGLEYDLDIYMIVAVDFFNMGAMENKGLNVFNTKYVLADENTATDTDYHGVEAVIAHEYFHNWTGNRVTCRDWFQLSLKEGLTVFRDQQFSADMGEEVLERIDHTNIMRAHQFAEDSGPMAHPIRPDKVIEMNNFYTVTVYDKGAEVIRMMHSLLGEQGFRKGMDLYFERHDGQAVTCDDFVNAMADASDVDLTLFRNWYSQAGTPVVEVNEEFNNGQYQLELSQSIPTRPSNENVKTLLIPVKYELLSIKDGTSIKRGTLEFSKPKQQFTFDIGQPCIAVLFESFSAPVKVKRHIDTDNLMLIAQYASDPFCRWDAIQTLWQRSVFDIEIKERLQSVIASVLADEKLEPAIKAELISVPSFAALTESQAQIEVERSLALLTDIPKEIGKHCFKILQQLINKHQISDSRYTKSNVANRRLCATLLFYLSHSSESEQLIIAYYENAKNMTDKMAALNASRIYSDELHEVLLNKIERDFHDNELVLDKLFASVARVDNASVYEQMDKWAQHPLFDRKNPNRMRSLYGAFISANVSQFHNVSGKGYQFLGDLLKELDKINPQVASRLITPLLSYKRYDVERAKLMEKTLKMLAGQTLSKDLFEKVNAAINE